jgi:predicted enzyme related to lactoylglutathione lyase
MKINSIMLGSENSKKLAAFYTKVLGEPSWQQDDWYAYFDGVSLMIGNHSEVKGVSKNPERLIIGFEVADVKKEFERIKGLGAKVIAKPYMPSPDSPDMWLATFADPDGNYFQLATPWKD